MGFGWLVWLLLIGAIIWAVKAMMDSQSRKTTIEFELFQHSLVRLDIFNLVGQRVATLLNGAVDAGTFHTTWNGKDEDGNILPSGIYVVFLQAGMQKARTSITLLK